MLNHVDPREVSSRLSAYWTAIGVVAALVLNFANPFSLDQLASDDMSPPDWVKDDTAWEVQRTLLNVRH
jgi:hypothetical protein